jgi:hypothetical protein
MYSVNQHWDPLKTCIVGRSYPPEFYSFITNSRARGVMERIAQETEEDYQILIGVLEKFNVKVLRPNLANSIDYYWNGHRYVPPPMTPRDYSAMIGTDFYISPGNNLINDKWDQWRSDTWPTNPPANKAEFDRLPESIQEEILQFQPEFRFKHGTWDSVIDHVQEQGNRVILDTGINTAGTTRVGRDLYFGTDYENENLHNLNVKYAGMFPDHRCHIIDTQGHADSTYCPVKPGLIVSLHDISTYADTFPEWEVVYLPGQSWAAVKPFLDLKEKNAGKWWVPGEELNDEFTDFVEGWLKNWVGYVEETVFDVNMLVIDEKNVLCNNYNKQVFDAFDRHGITPHVVNFRHRYFWDGGLHCITSDLDRTGVQKDYFPQRG